MTRLRRLRIWWLVLSSDQLKAVSPDGEVRGITAINETGVNKFIFLIIFRKVSMATDQILIFWQLFGEVTKKIVMFFTYDPDGKVTSEVKY